MSICPRLPVKNVVPNESTDPTPLNKRVKFFFPLKILGAGEIASVDVARDQIENISVNDDYFRSIRTAKQPFPFLFVGGEFYLEEGETESKIIRKHIDAFNSIPLHRHLPH